MKSFLSHAASLVVNLAIGPAIAPLFGVQLDRSFQATVPNGVVHTVVVTAEGDLLIGGEFSTINQKAVHSFAKLDSEGTVDPDFASLNPNGTVFALALSSDGKAYVGGNFKTIGGVNASGLACIDTNGAVNDAFVLSTAPDGRVDSLALSQDGNVLLAGAFRHVNGQPAQFVAQVDGADASCNDAFHSSLLNNFSLEAGVDALAVQLDGKVLVGGNFNTTSGFTYLTRVNSDGTIDPTFLNDFGPTLYVKAIRRLPHGKLLIAGTADSLGHGFVRRLNSDGSIDLAFAAPQLDGSVEAVSVDLVGRIVIGGSFMHVNGLERARLARLFADGRVDLNWRADANNVVKTIAFDPQGRILVGGAFNEIGGVAQSGIARLNEPSELMLNASSVSNNTGRIHLILKGIAGSKYRIESSGDLRSWTEFMTNNASESGALEITDAIMQGSRRFFRAVSVQ